MKPARVNTGMRPTTSFLLMAQYGGAAVIPIEMVQEHYFPHLSVEKLLRQILAGKIKLPIVRMTESRKTARGVHLCDLADFIDKAREAALRECEQLSGPEGEEAGK